MTRMQKFWTVVKVLGALSFLILAVFATWVLLIMWVGTGWHNQ